jgi:phosphocarrier protein FPr
VGGWTFDAYNRRPTVMSPQAASPLVLLAPLSGPVVPLDTVPDPVFAQKMVGDGVSIDPVSQVLLAPCAGRVVQLHSAGHALTLATADGIEVMIHIGLDTVSLKGQGFTPKVRNGDRVAAGAPLIEFDADFVATHARSLLTQIVITNGDRVSALRPATGRVVAGRDVVLTVELAGGAQATAMSAQGAAIESSPITVPNATGLHARPAAVLAGAAKKFKANVRLRRGTADANAKSVVAIMGLELSQGDEVCFVADGPDARAAIDALEPLLREGIGDEGAVARGIPRASAPAQAAPSARFGAGAELPALGRGDAAPHDPNLLVGVAASPGIAVGNVFRIRNEQLDVQELGDDATAERKRLDAAIEQGKAQLAALQDRLEAEADAGKAAIFAAHEELLDDPDLREIADHAIAAGKSAAFAWQQAVTMHADRLGGSKNALLAARANDLRDVGRRVLRVLSGTAATDRPDVPPDTILIAEDLSPSDTANLDRTRVLGFCTAGGGATSHVAILARSLDIPAVAGIDPRALDLADGTPVVVDGGKGTLRLNPSADEVASIRNAQERQAGRRASELASAHEPAVTKDGRRIEVVANIGGLADARQVGELGGEGVGLLRSEFLFLERATAPDEDEQFESYRDIARALGPGRPLIVRTLDVGGDKPLRYLPMPAEANPFLGERGIRVMLSRPELLRAQVRAILRASAEAGTRILVMFPMVATMADWRAARAAVDAEREQLGVAPIPVGIMVEVPSVAIMADQFAREVDFFSVGTNDLTQYTLAMDRGHPKLAAQVDGLNPGVLQLIANTADAAHRHGKWVGICGGIGADPQAVPLLVGLGVDELSVSVPAIPAVKAQVRRLDTATCRDLARRALTLDRGADVRALVGVDE